MHKFSPLPGERSTLLCIDGISGERFNFRWSTIRRTETPGRSTIRMPRRSFGALESGQRFAIMRCLLYTDDFKPMPLGKAVSEVVTCCRLVFYLLIGQA